MRRPRGLRQISPCELVLTLCAGFDSCKPALNREIDCLIIANLEMQEVVMLDGAPVAAEQRVGADEVDGAGDPAAVALGHHEQHVLAHGLADLREEGSREVWAAPFARTGLHVE